MADKESWAAAKKLVMDFTRSLRSRDAFLLLGDFHELIPFKRCFVWRWRVAPGKRIDPHDLQYMSITPDAKDGFHIKPVLKPDQQSMDADQLFGNYPSFLAEEVGSGASAPVFRAYTSKGFVTGFLYKPGADGAYSALVAQFEIDGSIDESERIRLFECNLPLLDVLFEWWWFGEEPENANLEASSLTRRQKAILGLLVEGKNTRRIAESLSVSERTVSWHLYNIYRKLGVRSRQEAIVAVQKLTFLRNE